MLKKLSVLLVENNPTVRARITATLKSVVVSLKLDVAHTTEIAEKKILSGKKYDFILVRSAKDLEPISALITAAPKGSKAPLVVVALRPSEQTSTVVAKLYLMGVHGIFYEPFSADQLLQTFTTARELDQERAGVPRQDSQAAGFLMADALKLIDSIAESMARGQAAGYAARELKEIGRSLHEVLGKVDPDEFLQILSSKLDNAKPSDRLVAQTKSRARKAKPSLHPGLVVRESLKVRGLNVEKLLSFVKVTADELTLMLQEKAPLTKEMAPDIARALGKTPEYWLRLQADYDDYQEFLREQKEQKGP